MYSAVCLLRGRIYDALENRQEAMEWYKCDAELLADAFICYDLLSCFLMCWYLLPNVVVTVTKYVCLHQ